MKREEFGEYIVRWGSLMINNPQSPEYEQASKELDIKYNELFDYIESIEAENKKLKDLRNDTVLIGQDDVEFLQSENKIMYETIEELRAKLEAIESNKVAEFSGSPYNGGIIAILASKIKAMGAMDSKKNFTVTISKDKQ